MWHWNALECNKDWLIALSINYWNKWKEWMFSMEISIFSYYIFLTFWLINASWSWLVSFCIFLGCEFWMKWNRDTLPNWIFFSTFTFKTYTKHVEKYFRNRFLLFLIKHFQTLAPKRALTLSGRLQFYGVFKFFFFFFLDTLLVSKV